MEAFFGMTNALPSNAHPDMILLVCAYICLPLRSAQPSTFCAALCKLVLFLFLHLETQLFPDGDAILVRNTPVEALLNWKTRVQETSTIILMMIVISSFDSCRTPFVWSEPICSDAEECMLCGLVFPQSPPNGCSSLWPLADTKFAKLLNSLKAPTSFHLSRGKKDCSRGGGHKSKCLDLSLSINSLLLWQQTGLSHFPTFSHVFW